MGFEPMMGVLQTPALTTWLRRLVVNTTRTGAEPPLLVDSFGAEEGI